MGGGAVAGAVVDGRRAVARLAAARAGRVAARAAFSPARAGAGDDVVVRGADRAAVDLPGCRWRAGESAADLDRARVHRRKLSVLGDRLRDRRGADRAARHRVLTPVWSSPAVAASTPPASSEPRPISCPSAMRAREAGFGARVGVALRAGGDRPQQFGVARTLHARPASVACALRGVATKYAAAPSRTHIGRFASAPSSSACATSCRIVRSSWPCWRRMVIGSRSIAGAVGGARHPPRLAGGAAEALDRWMHGDAQARRRRSRRSPSRSRRGCAESSDISDRPLAFLGAGQRQRDIGAAARSRRRRCAALRRVPAAACGARRRRQRRRDRRGRSSRPGK